MKKIALFLIIVAISVMVTSEALAQRGRARVRAGVRYGVGPGYGYRTPGYRYGYGYSYGPRYQPGARYRYGPGYRYDYRYDPGPGYRYGYRPGYRYGYRYGYGPGFRYGYRYPYHHHRRYYYGWQPGWWTIPGTWGLGSRWWSWNTPDTYTYYNPYAGYTQDSIYDYSDPVSLYTEDTSSSQGDVFSSTEGSTTTGTTQSATDSTTISPTEQAAMQYFQKAREAFKKGDYSAAMREIDQAINKLPKDAAFHEFRGLVLFAQGRYNQAAGVLNSVLASGPGWNWNTMISLYQDSEQYTKQLRDLEEFVRQNKDDAAAKFLLAYEYLVMGHTKNAATQLKDVVRLQPKDVLSQRLLKTIEGSGKEPNPTLAPQQPAAEQ